MRSTIVSIFLALFFFFESFLMISQSNSIIEFSDWKYQAANDPIHYPAQVPGNIFLDLYQNGIIPNPLLGSNEKDVQWVSQQDWEYHAHFDLSESQYAGIQKDKNIVLHLPEIDTYSDVYINDKWVFRTDNSFIHWQTPINSFIQTGKNEIKLILHSPYKIAKEKLKILPYPIPGDSIRSVIRKPQYEFGWDWGPSLAGCGIRQKPYLHIQHLSSISEHWLKIPAQPDQLFELHFRTARLENDHLMALLKDENGNELGRIDDIPNQLDQEILFDLKSQPIWHSNGKGKPNLTTLHLELWHQNVRIDHKQITTGKRAIELVQEKDQWGTSFYFQLNGEKIFMKGANYIPIRFFHEQATRSDYENLISQCKKANINMLRVWGGGIYEPDIFYELCDQNGILIWQDFMFACSMYPGDEGFLNSIQKEAEQQVKRLSHHPCMALWCGNNENSEGWERWGWQSGLSEKNKKAIQKAYDDVFLKLLKNTTHQFSNTTYWPSSPQWGRGDERSLIEGDCHYWGVWHDAEPFEILQTKIPRFMSEFGMQSYPSREVIDEMCDKLPCNEKDQGKLIHQKHNRGFQLMHQYMKYWHPTGEGLMGDDYGLLTQYVQAEGITMGIEAQRRHSDRCGGTLFWQLNDVWPAYSWSAMDYHFQPKPLMEQLTYAYAPFLASLENQDGNVKIYVINELEKMENASITIQYLEEGAIRKDWTFQTNITSNSQVVWKDKTQLKPKEDSQFKITIHHVSLPNGRYERVIKGTPSSKKFMVPTIQDGIWTCQPLFSKE